MIEGGISTTRRANVYALARRHMNIDNVLGLAARQDVELRHPLHDLRLLHFLITAAGGVLWRGNRTK